MELLLLPLLLLRLLLLRQKQADSTNKAQDSMMLESHAPLAYLKNKVCQGQSQAYAVQHTP